MATRGNRMCSQFFPCGCGDVTIFDKWTVSDQAAIRESNHRITRFFGFKRWRLTESGCALPMESNRAHYEPEEMHGPFHRKSLLSSHPR